MILYMGKYSVVMVSDHLKLQSLVSSFPFSISLLFMSLQRFGDHFPMDNMAQTWCKYAVTQTSVEHR